MTINIELLRKVREAIQNHKESFNWTTWIKIQDKDPCDLTRKERNDAILSLLKEDTCGTSGCIAGFTCAIVAQGQDFSEYMDVQYFAKDALLSYNDQGTMEQKADLFVAEDWFISGFLFYAEPGLGFNNGLNPLMSSEDKWEEAIRRISFIEFLHEQENLDEYVRHYFNFKNDLSLPPADETYCLELLASFNAIYYV